MTFIRALWRAAAPPVALAAVLSLAPTEPARAMAAAPIVMKLGTGTLNDSQHEWLKRFAAYVQRDSGGRVVAQVYPAGQLGSVPRMVEELQFGSIQGMVLPLDFMQGIDERFQLMDAPGLFDDFAQTNATLADPRIRAAFLDIARAKGITGLQMFSEGPVSYITRRPARSYTELKGWKIRVLAGAMQRGLMDRLQAAGVPLPLDQLSPAMQQGAVDAAILNIGVAQVQGLESSAHYSLELRDCWPPGIAIFNTTWYDALPSDLRSIVDAAGERATREVRLWAERYVARAKRDWVAAGGVIFELTPTQRRAFVALVAPVGEGVAHGDPQLERTWNLVVQVAAAHRTSGTRLAR